MILLVALIAGLLAGWGWARWQDQPYRAPGLRSVWLAFVAFVPQLVIAYLPATRTLLPDWLAALSLSASLVLFGAFGWLNRSASGMPILLAGLILNLSVILANGGWMPISPQVASRVMQADVLQFQDASGSRFGEKDILLSPEATRLEFLADRFLLPDWLPYRAAFSLGDVFVAVGIFWLLLNPSIQSKVPQMKEVIL